MSQETKDGHALNEQRPTHKRYGILALIFFTVVINYLDRTNISIASVQMQGDLGLSDAQMGLIFSAFAWTYANLQIPGGLVVDKFAARILYPVMLVLWSVATLIQGLISSLGGLIGCRMAIGVFEAPSYPCNNKIVTNWFPEKERAGAIGIYTAGQFMGMAFLAPILFWIQELTGWRGLLIISGVIGIVWAGVWYALYRDPKDHPTVNEAELKHIRDGGGLVDEQNDAEDSAKEGMTFADFAEVFRYRKLWGIYLGQFCMGSLTMFFLTWFPKYLVEARGINLKESASTMSVAYMSGFAGVVLAGQVSDLMVRRGFSKEVARKLPVLIGMLLSVIIIATNYTDSTVWAAVFLSLAFFGNGLASITWVFISLMAPKKMVGLAGGAFNFIGGLSAIVTPLAIGFLVKREEGQVPDFSPALFYVGGLALLGFFSFLLVVGKVERVGEAKAVEA